MFFRVSTGFHTATLHGCRFYQCPSDSEVIITDLSRGEGGLQVHGRFSSDLATGSLVSVPLRLFLEGWSHTFVDGVSPWGSVESQSLRNRNKALPRVKYISLVFFWTW